MLWNDGAIIAGVSDFKGAIWNPRGIDIPQLEAHVAATGSVVDFPGTDALSNAQILEQPCDVLIPAAVGSQLHAGNADRIKASIVAEGANGPTTPEADQILRDRGVTVIPDILSNAGGVVVSYFEWVQGLQHYFWTESRDHRAAAGADGARLHPRVAVRAEGRRQPAHRGPDGGRAPRRRRPRRRAGCIRSRAHPSKTRRRESS